MAKVKNVGVRELKSKLSAYLRDVKAGDTIIVQDRDECIAEIRKSSSQFNNPVLQAWVSGGEVIAPISKHHNLKKSPISTDGDLARQLLDAERGE